MFIYFILYITLFISNSHCEPFNSHKMIMSMHSDFGPSALYRTPKYKWFKNEVKQIKKDISLTKKRLLLLKKRKEVKKKNLPPLPQKIVIPKSIDLSFDLKGVPLYSQGVVDPFDPRGRKGQYPQGYCGPTSMQMVLQYYGIKKSRDYLALTNVGAGKMYVPGLGSFYPRMVIMAKHLGFTKSRLYMNQEYSKLIKSVKDGRPQIVRFTGRINYQDGTSYKPRSGHIVVVKGIQPNGNLIIHDPGRGRQVRVMNPSQFLRNWHGITVDIKA